MNEHIIDLLRFVHSVNSEKYVANFNYSGLGSSVTISTYAGEWYEGKDFSIYMGFIPVETLTAEECESIKAEIMADMEKAVKHD